jgi:opacity protein-like surface antigen
MKRILIVALASMMAASRALAADLPDLTGNAACNHGYSCGYDVAATSTTTGATTTTTPPVGVNTNVKLNENIVRVGLNFKFGH